MSNQHGRCPWWCVEQQVAHVGDCRSEAARVTLALQPPIWMNDDTRGPDFTEVGVGLEGGRVPYVFDMESYGRENMFTPAEARAKASALSNAADVADGTRSLLAFRQMQSLQSNLVAELAEAARRQADTAWRLAMVEANFR